jgi:hypothetical protein
VEACPRVMKSASGRHSNSSFSPAIATTLVQLGQLESGPSPAYNHMGTNTVRTDSKYMIHHQQIILLVSFVGNIFSL